MRKLLATCVFAFVLMSPPALASGSSPSTPGGTGTAPGTGVGLPIYSPTSATVAPPGFTATAAQAEAAAKATRTMQALHAREHPLYVQPVIWAGHKREWFVDFYFHGKLLAEVVVSPIGRVEAVWTGPLAIAVYARGHYAPIFDSWWVVVPFSLLFLVPFLDPRRLKRLVHLDALVLLSFFVSYALFDHAKLVLAVWLVYPPLIYLLVRMLGIGIGRHKRTTGLSAWLSTRWLAVGLVLLVGARIALSLVSHTVIDAGYASVIGAHRISHGLPLYYSAAAHADTYGPIAYLAYVPFELVFPWHGVWDYLASAHAASIAFDLVTIVGLFALGRRLRPGAEGKRIGLALAWGWAACPFTLLALMMHTNDGLIAMLSVLALVAFASPAARGALLGLAAAAKFAPAILLPLFAPVRRRGLKGAAVCVAAFAAVVFASITLYLPSGGLAEFYNHTIGFQLDRPDVFSIWALHPSLDPLKALVEACALLLAAALAFVPRARSLTQVGALAAALTIAVQLPAVHWFYYYIVWFLPFLLVALLTEDSPRLRAPSQDYVPTGEPRTARRTASETALAGV